MCTASFNRMIPIHSSHHTTSSMSVLLRCSTYPVAAAVFCARVERRSSPSDPPQGDCAWVISGSSFGPGSVLAPIASESCSFLALVSKSLPRRPVEACTCSQASGETRGEPNPPRGLSYSYKFLHRPSCNVLKPPLEVQYTCTAHRARR